MLFSCQRATALLPLPGGERVGVMGKRHIDNDRSLADRLYVDRMPTVSRVRVPSHVPRFTLILTFSLKGEGTSQSYRRRW